MIKYLVKHTKGFLAYKDLLVQLVSRDLKLKYRRSVLGYLWSVLSPLMVMAVQVVVFQYIFKRPIPNYAVYLLSGQVLFNYMNQSTHQAIRSILDSASLIKKVYLPKYIFTMSKITSGLIDLVFSMGALAVVIIFTGVGFSWHFLLFPLVLIQLFVFCLGLGLFLAQANVFFRDVQYIYTVATTAWLYLTPIFYDIEFLPQNVRGINLQAIIKWGNPMFYYVSQFRSVVLYHTMPELDMVIAGCAASVIVLLLGAWSFVRRQDDFILYI